MHRQRKHTLSYYIRSIYIAKERVGFKYIIINFRTGYTIKAGGW